MAHPHRSPTYGGGELAGEVLLAIAVLTQARKDLGSPRHKVRTAAQQFWRDDQDALQFWSDLLGVDRTVLRQRAELP
jgi:hypothetical protein